MKSYEIGCKYYYYETSEYGNEIIKVPNKIAAVNKFAKKRHLKDLKLKDYENWQW